MTEETTPAPDLPPPETPPARVILIPDPGRGLMRALALALAEGGHSLILWAGPAGAGSPGRDGGDDALLDLQLAIARAGGISLGVAGADLAGAAEALGRIDAAVALGLEEAARVAAALAPLERGRRPGRLLVLHAAGEAGAQALDLPPGLRVSQMEIPAPRADAAELGRIVHEIIMIY